MLLVALYLLLIFSITGMFLVLIGQFITLLSVTGFFVIIILACIINALIFLLFKRKKIL